MQIRTIMASLLALIFLLTDVQAKPNTTDLALAEHQQCGVYSPLFIALGDAYFDLDEARKPAATPLMDIEQNKLLSHLSTQSFQDGWGHRVSCTGSSNHTLAYAKTVSLEDISAHLSDFSSFRNTIHISAFEYDESQRRLRRETVTIPTSLENLMHLSENRLLSTFRHRQVTPVGSYLEETRIEASISDQGITIKQSVFVNGTLAQWHTWHLPG